MLPNLVGMSLASTVVDVDQAVFVLVFGCRRAAQSHAETLISSRGGVYRKVHVVVRHADSALAYGSGCLGAVGLPIVVNPTVRQDHLGA